MVILINKFNKLFVKSNSDSILFYILGLRKMTVLSSAETAEQPPRKKLCLSASRQLQAKSYALSQLNPMASPLDQPGN